MRLKEVERTAVQVWSPAAHYPVYLATGTSAQQLDASFSTNAALEIFEVDFGDPSVEMKNRGVLPFPSRFHKLIWGSYGMCSPDFSGVIVGGGDNGVITLYSASQILTAGKEPIIGHSDKHTGPVRALDFNPFQSNLLASGANDSEIYIWDLNNFSVPMTPGSKTQPNEDICIVAWNRQVQHILASAHPSGKAVVWDLRKNEPIIKVSDHSNRMHCSGMMWHPEVPTQLVLSSEDDRMPVIQIWDLRFATSPLKVLENHARGVLSISWCQADPELLLSSAKDDRILCWNPSIGEVVYELPTRSHWCFDVQWCPRNPSVFSAASLDGWINVYSIMGGSLDAQQKKRAEKISSFNAVDPFGTGQPLPPLQLPHKVALTTSVPPLKRPPRWICRPVGCSFAFGGKLITFSGSKAPPQQALLPSRQVFISQVVTEEEFLSRARDLQTALVSGNLLRYCQSKIQNAQIQLDKNIWNFLKVNFEQDARTKFLKLLGYSKDDLDNKIASCLGASAQSKDKPLEAGDHVQRLPSNSSQVSGMVSGQASSASSSPSDFYSLLGPDTDKFEIPVTADTDGLICQSLLVGNFKGAVELCLNDNRFADAIILAIAGGDKLLKETQQRYFSQQKNKITSLLSSVVKHNWRNIVLECNLHNWKEALAILLTYAKTEEYAELCDTLGIRLESEGNGRLSSQACLCYISSGNVKRLVECWVKTHETSSPMALQDLVEKVMVLRRSIELLGGSLLPAQGPVLDEKVTQYANLLASQGSLAAAMSYLPNDSEEDWIEQLRDRLFHAQGEDVSGQLLPPFPFPKPFKASNSHPSSTMKGGETPHSASPNLASGQVLYHQSVNCQVPSQPSVAPLFTPQPLPTSMVATTGIPFFGTSEPSTVYSRSGALPVYPQNPTRLAGPAQSTSHSLSMMGLTFTSATTSVPGFGYQVGAGFSIGRPASPSVNPIASSRLPPPPRGGTVDGWNDPPSHRGGFTRKKLPEVYNPQVPITTPVMNVHSEIQGLQAPTNLQDSVQAAPGAPTGTSLQEIHQMPVEKIEKKALPHEHKLLKSTFEGLVQRCSSVASDPKTKRKLEDAFQRLECLYDKLREHTLSPHILSGLHEIARCIEDRNYQQGLIVHTQVVSSSNFSEISSFMPVLKIIMTLATKLGV